MTAAVQAKGALLYATTCVVCGSDCVHSWSGHVHTSAGEVIIAGWCEQHHREKQRAESSLFPGIAMMWPSRREKWMELTRTAHEGCFGCFGDVDVQGREHA